MLAALSLSVCLALFHSVWFVSLYSRLASVQRSLLHERLPENETEKRCRLMIWLEAAHSVAVFILFRLFFSSLHGSLSVCSSDLTS